MAKMKNIFSEEDVVPNAPPPSAIPHVEHLPEFTQNTGSSGSSASPKKRGRKKQNLNRNILVQIKWDEQAIETLEYIQHVQLQGKLSRSEILMLALKCYAQTLPCFEDAIIRDFLAA